MIKASSYMSSPVRFINADKNCQEALATMYEHNIGALLVKDGHKYVGIITKTDWYHKVLNGDGNQTTSKVSEIMTSPIISIDKEDSLAKASELMNKNKIRHIAIADKGKIVGILSVKDLEKHFRKS